MQCVNINHQTAGDGTSSFSNDYSRVIKPPAGFFFIDLSSFRMEHA